MPNDELRLPTIKVAVEVAMLGAEPVPMVLFLAESRHHLEELLDSEEQFLPAAAQDDGAVELINKKQLLWLKVGLLDGKLPVEIADLDQEEALYECREDVLVEFQDGHRVAGEFLYTPKEGKGRVADYLNRSADVITLWTDSALYVINKNRVTKVRELGASAGESGEQ